MVLLLYLWENVKKWSSHEEMRENQLSENNMPYEPKPYGAEQDYQQMGGLRRLDSASGRTHFYPEGGWGWIVCACAFLAHVTTSGAQLSAGALHIVLVNKFPDSQNAHWVGPFSWSVSSVCSPLVVNLCRRKNVRILSLIGGFLFPLSLLCTSFTVEIHQFFFSFGLVGGIGSCLVRESSGIVLGEYFRRRRQFVEQVVMAGTGVGVTLFSLLYLSLSRHIEWSHGFRIGAALSLICAVLPAFYRAASIYHPHHTAIQQLKEQKQRNGSSFFIPLGSDICHSLNLFCVPSLKPILWSVGISSFGLFTPCFLMSDFGKSEGLSGGSLLLLQTHLGLGLSLGVILGAILTLKKFRCCRVSPRMLCCSTGILTGLSMIAISSVQGYYGYSLSAWIYGIALGSYLYTLKTLTMDLTRTKHWERIWSCVQSLMGPGVLIGTVVTSYLGKSGFYACATCVLLGAGIIGMELIDLSKCGSPQLSSVDNESPIPPAPPPILPSKYGQSLNSQHNPGFYPLRRSMSLQQPIYSFCPDGFGNYNHNQGYSPFCADCNPSQYPSMVRSLSLPQPHFRNTGTQTNPNSPERNPHNGRLDLLQQTPGRLPSAQKNSVMFASNPQLFPSHDQHFHIPQHQQQVHIPLQHNHPSQQTRSNRSSAERFPDIPIEPQFTSAGSLTSQQQEPAFTRHYFDSSQMVPPQKKNDDQHKQLQQAEQRQISVQQQQHMSNPQSQQRIYTQNPAQVPIVSNQQLPFVQNQQPLSVQNQHIPLAQTTAHQHSALKNHSQSNQPQQSRIHHQLQQSSEEVRDRRQQQQSRDQDQPQPHTRMQYRTTQHHESHEENQYHLRDKNSQHKFQSYAHIQQQPLPKNQPHSQQSFVQNQPHSQQSFVQNQPHSQHTFVSNQPHSYQQPQQTPFTLNPQKSSVLNQQQQSFLQNQPYYFSQNQPFVINAQQSYPQSFQLPSLQSQQQQSPFTQNLSQYPQIRRTQNQPQVQFDPQLQSNRINACGSRQQIFLEQNTFHQNQQRPQPPDSYFYNNSLHHNQQNKKFSSAEFEVEEPRFHSLRRPILQPQRSCFVTDGSASNAPLWQASTESKYLEYAPSARLS